MPHNHSHENHHHHHAPADVNRAFIIGMVLNIGFVIIETIAGFWQGSLALITDAGHNLGDVAGLAMVLIAGRIAKRKPNDNYTYGYGKSTVLVALMNAGLLLLAVGAISWEAFGRIMHPREIEGGIISVVAVAGIIINGITALLFLKDRKKDLNIQGAYLHMLADALVSAGVAISGVMIMFTNWYWLDSAISIVVCVVILYSTWGLLRDSLRLTLDGVPQGINTENIRKFILGLDGVKGVHDLHIWALSTNANALTAHVLYPGEDGDAFIAKITDDLHHHFNIDHSTIQLEKSGDSHCVQDC